MICLHPSTVSTAVACQLRCLRVGRWIGHWLGALHYACLILHASIFQVLKWWPKRPVDPRHCRGACHSATVPQ